MSAYSLGKKEPSSPISRWHVLRPEHPDERTLWKSFLQGDEQAFVTVYDQHIKSLYSYGLKLCKSGDQVKDTIQDLFIELWRNRCNLGETDNIKFYLYKSLRRKLFRTTSRLKDNIFVELTEQCDKEASNSAEFEIVLEQTVIEQKQLAMKLLNSLSPRQREAVYLKYFEEMDYDKISIVMELSKQCVYNLVYKAIESLKLALTADR